MPKRTNNPELSQAKILESAQSLFIKRGYDGVSMSAIARHSGVTQSMIHHYFGSKEELWQAVKKHAYGHYLAFQQELLDAPEGDIGSFIQDSVRGRFRFFQDNPQTARLLAWLQMMEDPAGMETGQETGRQMLARIHQAQEAGELRDDIEGENILAISIALTTHWFQSRHFIENLTGITPETRKSADARFLEAIIKVLVDGLQPSDS